MPTTHLGRAMGVTVYGDESGFELHISTEQGEYVVNVHGCSENLLEEVTREIGEYWEEARSEMARAKILAPRRIDEGAYPPGDPKHPDYADLWDAIDSGSLRSVVRRLPR